MSINAVDGYALEDFSIDNVRAQLSEAQKVASGSGSEQDIAEAKIEIEVSSPGVLLSASCVCANTPPGSRDSPGPPEVDVTPEKSLTVVYTKIS